jgi:outer membrane protein OmpA-like peptidoglycan-associated protein
MVAAAVAAAPGSAAAGSGTGPVPVLGRTTIDAGGDVSWARVTALVHGVRRIPNGTVLYWSFGVPAGATTEGLTVESLSPSGQLQDRYGSSSTRFGSPQVIDAEHHRVYTTLVDGPGGNALASPNSALPSPMPAGRFYSAYEVLPALPADVASVDVALGGFNIVHDVPVQDGALTPAAPQTGPLALGSGWPAVDPAAVASSYQPEKAVYSWDTSVFDLDGSSVTREGTKRVTVDLSADVLFAVDSAELTPAAIAKVRKAAATVNERAAAGAVSVIGHTDNTGSSTHNDDLSKRRAAAVAKVLRPLVTAPGVTLTTSGVGEADPVEDNATAEGRRANRRVSIVFAPKEG